MDDSTGRFSVRFQAEEPFVGWQIVDTKSGVITHAYLSDVKEELCAREVTELMNRLPEAAQDDLVSSRQGA
jgi:hypothetical protein